MALSVSNYEKLTLILSVVLFSIYTVAFSSPRWMSKDIPLPHSLNLNLAMGLFKFCKELTSPIPSHPMVKMMPSNCTSDGAEDWQIVAGCCAIAALVLSLGIAVVSFVLVFAQNVKGNIKLQCFQAVLQFLTAATLVTTLMLHAFNNRFGSKPPKEPFTLELGWGYKIAIAAALLCGFNLLCTICHIMTHQRRSERTITHSPKSLTNSVTHHENLWSHTNHGYTHS